MQRTASGVAIITDHITELRSYLNVARDAVGLPMILNFTDPSLTKGSTAIKAVHIQQLRDGLK